MVSANSIDRAVLRLTHAYNTDDEGEWIPPPPRKDGTIAMVIEQRHATVLDNMGDDLVLLHRFDSQSAGASPADSSGNGLTGTCTNMKETIDNLAASGSSSGLSSTLNTKAAQSFTVKKDSHLNLSLGNQLHLVLKKVGAPTGDMSIWVGPSRDSSAGGALINVDVATLTTSFATYDHLMGNFVLSPGTTYYVVIEYTGGDGSNYVEWRHDGGTDTYSGGQASTYNGGAWGDAATTDHAFKITLNEDACVWLDTAKYGRSAQFDGVDDVIIIPDNAALDVTRITVSAWVRPRTIVGVDVVLVKEAAYFLNLNSSGVVEGGVIIGGVTKSASSAGSSTPADVWTHVAMTYDGANVQIYINGVASGGASPATGDIDATVGQVYIGRNVGAGDHFIGFIDDVRIYSKALSAASILELYNASGSYINGWSGTATITATTSAHSGGKAISAVATAGQYIEKTLSADWSSYKYLSAYIKSNVASKAFKLTVYKGATEYELPSDTAGTTFARFVADMSSIADRTGITKLRITFVDAATFTVDTLDLLEASTPAAEDESSEDELMINVHGTVVELDPVNSRVTISKGAASRGIRTFEFTAWEITALEPDGADPQMITIQIGHGAALEVYALFPGVVRFVDPHNHLIFTEEVPADTESNADVDPVELNDDDWYIISNKPWTLTGGLLEVGHESFVGLIHETDESSRAWLNFLNRCEQEDLRIRPTGPGQMAQVFWLAWWKQTEIDNESVFKQVDFDTISGEALRAWARVLGIEVVSTTTDARLRVQLKGRILKRHGIIQPGRLIRAIRAMIGTTAPGGITLFENSDTAGEWEPRYVRVRVDASLFEDAEYDPSEYLDVLTDIETLINEALPVTIRLEMELVGGAVYDGGDNYDGGSVYG